MSVQFCAGDVESQLGFSTAPCNEVGERVARSTARLLSVADGKPIWAGKLRWRNSQRTFTFQNTGFNLDTYSPRR
jgi:hypothetical protein